MKGKSLESRTYRALPPQKVSNSVKQSKEWKESNVASIISMSTGDSTNGRATKRNKQVNYDLINSRFKQQDFANVLNPLGIDNTQFQGSAVQMQNYNIIRPEIETLKGEEMKMGLDLHAVAVNGEAVSERNKAKVAAIKDAIKQRAIAIAKEDINPETGEPNAPNPAEVASKFKTEYANPTEITTNKLIKFLIKNDLLQMKFAKGWEHALISSEELYYVSISDGHPSSRSCNPLNITFDREVENPFVHLSDWAMEERWMPVGSVIDLYGSSMSDDLVKRLDSGELGGKSVMNNGMSKDFAYDFEGGMSIDSGMSSNTSHVYVANVVWRSYKKEGLLTYLDPRTGMMEATTVDDSFVLDREMKDSGATVDWTWKTEIWQGIRIGHDDYLDIRPLDNQTGNLPYVGYVYNNVNSIATSMVDMCKPHQYTYLITWYRLEQELAKSKGKKFVMDLAQLPKSKGWTVDQWMYYFDNLNVAWINSKEEGRKGDPNSVAKFNQFTSIDMALSQVVGQYMMVLNKLEEQVSRISGVSRQREGEIGASETATGAQRAIIQSTNNTKPLFFYHDLVRQTVIQEMVELAKVAYADGREIQWLDEESVETIKIDSGMLNGSDIAVFITNSFEDNENIGKMERLLDIALQQDKAKLSDIAIVLGSKSLTQVRDTLIAGERDKEAREEAAQKAQQEAEAAIQQQLSEDKDKALELETYKIDTDSATKIEVALIGQENTDVPEDNTEQVYLDNRKQEHLENVKEKELKLKEKALSETSRSNKAKESISRTKNNSNGKN